MLHVQGCDVALFMPSLPEGLLCSIFVHLGPVELLYSGSVCQHWHLAASNQYVMMMDDPRQVSSLISTS